MASLLDNLLAKRCPLRLSTKVKFAVEVEDHCASEEVSEHAFRVLGWVEIVEAVL